MTVKEKDFTQLCPSFFAESSLFSNLYRTDAPNIGNSLVWYAVLYLRTYVLELLAHLVGLKVGWLIRSDSRGCPNFQMLKLLLDQISFH